LLIFQESIFSQTHLLNDEYVKFIIDLCKKLTLIYNISIHINLLHQFDNDKCPSWITGAASIEKDVNSAGIDTGTTVANYSLIISKGNIVNAYIKTEHDDTLKDESADLLIKEKFRLRHGTLESYDLVHGFHLSQFIATRICADINLLATSSTYDLSLNKLHPKGVFITQSNTLPLFNIKNILIKLKSDILDSYLSRLIIHCDPGNGASVFRLIPQKTVNLFAYSPVNDPDWPKIVDFFGTKTRISSGIEVDVNSEDCSSKEENRKLFYINVWNIEPEAAGKFLEKEVLDY
jgi:hypothetical protein